MEDSIGRQVVALLGEIRDLLATIDARGRSRERIQDERWAQLDAEAAQIAAEERQARGA